MKDTIGRALRASSRSLDKIIFSQFLTVEPWYLEINKNQPGLKHCGFYVSTVYETILICTVCVVMFTLMDICLQNDEEKNRDFPPIIDFFILLLYQSIKGALWVIRTINNFTVEQIKMNSNVINEILIRFMTEKKL